MAKDAVPHVARYQGGAFTRAQALDEGWSGSGVDRRLASAQWRLVCGKALTARATSGPDTLAWGARLTWRDAVSSHVTAALLHRFPVPPDGVSHVTVAGPRSAVRGVRFHRGVLADGDVVQLDKGVALTSRVRTALDCLRLLDLDAALELYAWLSARQVVDRRTLEDALAEAPGRRGNRQLARLLDETEDGALSRAERRLHGLLQAAGVTGWVANARLVLRDGVVVVDVLFAAQRVVVEIDGYRAHSGREAFVRDRRRQNDLVGAGYLVLRFTWADLQERPEAVIRQILDALSGRG